MSIMWMWIFLIILCVGLPLMKILMDMPQKKSENRIKELNAQAELERLKQENYLLENAQLQKELDEIRSKNNSA